MLSTSLSLNLSHYRICTPRYLMGYWLMILPLTLINLVSLLRSSLDLGSVTTPKWRSWTLPGISDLHLKLENYIWLFLLISRIAFNCIYSSYILLCILEGGVSKQSVMVIADSMTRRVFAVLKPEGSISSWYPFARGFGQGSRGGGLFYNASSRVVPSPLHPSCFCHMFADDKTVKKRCYS